MIFVHSLTLKNESQHDKTNKVTVRQAKTQISLGSYFILGQNSWIYLLLSSTHFI